MLVCERKNHEFIIEFIFSRYAGWWEVGTDRTLLGDTKIEAFVKAIAADAFEKFLMLCRCGGARIFQVRRKIIAMIEVYLYGDEVWH